MLHLPSPKSPIGKLVDIEALAAAVATPEGRESLKSFSFALRSAREYLRGDPCATSVTAVGLRASGPLVLFRVYKNGEHKELWDFGDPYMSA